MYLDRLFGFQDDIDIRARLSGGINVTSQTSAVKIVSSSSKQYCDRSTSGTSVAPQSLVVDGRVYTFCGIIESGHYTVPRKIDVPVLPELESRSLLWTNQSRSRAGESNAEDQIFDRSSNAAPPVVSNRNTNVSTSVTVIEAPPSTNSNTIPAPHDAVDLSGHKSTTDTIDVVKSETVNSTIANRVVVASADQLQSLLTMTPVSETPPVVVIENPPQALTLSSSLAMPLPTPRLMHSTSLTTGPLQATSTVAEVAKHQSGNNNETVESVKTAGSDNDDDLMSTGNSPVGGSIAQDVVLTSSHLIFTPHPVSDALKALDDERNASILISMHTEDELQVSTNDGEVYDCLRGKDTSTQSACTQTSQSLCPTVEVTTQTASKRLARTTAATLAVVSTEAVNPSNTAGADPANDATGSSTCPEPDYLTSSSSATDSIQSVKATEVSGVAASCDAAKLDTLDSSSVDSQVERVALEAVGMLVSERIQDLNEREGINPKIRVRYSADTTRTSSGNYFNPQVTTAADHGNRQKLHYMDALAGIPAGTVSWCIDTSDESEESFVSVAGMSDDAADNVQHSTLVAADTVASDIAATSENPDQLISGIERSEEPLQTEIVDSHEGSDTEAHAEQTEGVVFPPPVVYPQPVPVQQPIIFPQLVNSTEILVKRLPSVQSLHVALPTPNILEQAALLKQNATSRPPISDSVVSAASSVEASLNVELLEQIQTVGPVSRVQLLSREFMKSSPAESSVTGSVNSPASIASSSKLSSSTLILTQSSPSARPSATVDSRVGSSEKDAKDVTLIEVLKQLPASPTVRFADHPKLSPPATPATVHDRKAPVAAYSGISLVEGEDATEPP